MSIVLQSSGGGQVTLQEPTTASNYTITVPAATTTMVGTDATQTLTNKTLTTPNIDSAQVATVSGTAPLYMCRAWVNFDGTGTVAIRASGNVSSITDNGTGNYTVNFTIAMPDANYCLTGGGQYQTAGSGADDVPSVGIVASNINANSLQTGSANIGTSTDTAAAVDPLTVCIAIFR